MYNKGDDSYLRQPKFMKPEVYTRMFERIKDHCAEHDLKSFAITIHGGEPLLVGKKYMRDFIRTGRAILEDVEVVFSLQTNGILLDNEWCDLFEEFNIRCGISIDVSQSSHDMYRIDHQGKGTYARTIAGLRIAQEHPYVKKSCGALAVIDVNTDPTKVYDHFDSIGIRGIDLLMPDNNYADLPAGMNKNYEEEKKNTPYANWLIPIFDRWMADHGRIRIRLFRTIVNLILGRKIGNDALGNVNSNLIVIETDGGIEPVDSLKICGPQFTKLGLNVMRNELKDIFMMDLYQKYYHGKTRLPETCQSCAISAVCGGGFLPNRYSHTTGFDNPSVYCLDLLKLITHIQNVVVAQFTADELAELEIEPLTYEEALSFINGQSWQSSLVA